MSKLKVGDRVTADVGAGQQAGKIVGRWAFGFMVLFDVAPPREYNMGENPAAMLPSFWRPRVTEPTPLSAEQPYSRDELVHLAENMRHSTVQQIVGATEQKTINRLLATIDAQAAEIAALKGALGKTAEFLNGLAKADALPIGIADIQQEGARLDAIVLRVLAGKEAQR